MSNKTIIQFASFYCLIAVILGAFGAHMIKDSIPINSFESYRTATFYMFTHSLALLFLTTFNTPNLKVKHYIAISFIVGIFLFSGSIYLLTTASITGIPTGFLGPLTPIGGLFLISGWATLFLHSFQLKKSN